MARLVVKRQVRVIANYYAVYHPAFVCTILPKCGHAAFLCWCTLRLCDYILPASDGLLKAKTPRDYRPLTC